MDEQETVNDNDGRGSSIPALFNSAPSEADAAGDHD
jgi:hypothetical protein